MKEKQVLINEWEKLNRISNRRLNVPNRDTLIKLDWSIDRITIVGTLKKDIIYHGHNQPFFIDFEQLMRLNEGNGNLKAVGNKGWKLIDNFGENIAYIEISNFHENKGRIDFNPNKINEFLASSMKNFIHDLFLEPHFSRADIACDMIDVPDNFIIQYRVADPISFRPIYGRSGKLETAYWGSRSSERQIRLYNKKLEQESKKKVVPKEIETWWRLELQLRRGKASNWHDMVLESLNSFASPHYLADDVRVNDKIMLLGLLDNHHMWGELERKMKYKLRNILKEESKNDELTNHLRETFFEKSDELKIELDTWLQGLDVSDE